MSEIHSVARTTPRVRAEIKASSTSINTLAECYNISRATARKWKQREEVKDRSHRAHNLQTTLTPAQEILVVERRRTLQLPLDDLLLITREFINPATSRSGLDRCLRRHGVANLKDLQAPSADGEIAPKKTFKDFAPGFVRRLKRVAPIKIQTVLTDNGSQFTDRFTKKNKQVPGRHAFDQACASHGIDHRPAPPRHP